MIKLKPSLRGSLQGEFFDRSGKKCSIQESTFPDEPAIWLGSDVDMLDRAVNARMHLTQQQARDLLPLIRHFARTGSLGYDDPKEEFPVGQWVLGIGETNRGVEGRVIESVPGQSLTVQDNRRTAPDGQIVCLWENVFLVWERLNITEGPSRFERLLHEPDLV